MYPKEYNDYNSDEVDFKVKTGELLLFPSHLQHRVNTTKNDNVRISLAFNSFVKGEFGHIQALNYLEL
jgi:cupin superfamily acireductone dioxygenase involved in methionine salvage